VDPKTGKSLDDIKPYIEGIPWLTDADRRGILRRQRAEGVHAVGCLALRRDCSHVPLGAPWRGPIAVEAQANSGASSGSEQA